MDPDTRRGEVAAHMERYKSLSPTQRYVYDLLKRGPRCRLDFAAADVWEVSNRITEVEERMGIVINRDRCGIHAHRHPVTRYSL